MDDGALDGRPRRRVVRQAGPAGRRTGSAAFAAAIALGFQHVFDPPDDDDEILLVIEGLGEPLDDQPVWLDYDPTSAPGTRAHVRPWLL